MRNKVPVLFTSLLTWNRFETGRGIVKTSTCHYRSTGNTMAHDYCGFQDKALTSSH